jgi:hypothetical protein
MDKLLAFTVSSKVKVITSLVMFRSYDTRTGRTRSSVKVVMLSALDVGIATTALPFMSAMAAEVIATNDVCMSSTSPTTRVNSSTSTSARSTTTVKPFDDAVNDEFDKVKDNAPADELTLYSVTCVASNEEVFTDSEKVNVNSLACMFRAEMMHTGDVVSGVKRVASNGAPAAMATTWRPTIS